MTSVFISVSRGSDLKVKQRTVPVKHKGQGKYESTMKAGTNLTLTPILQIDGIDNAGSTKKTYKAYKKHTNTKVVYSSSDISVATVSKKGKISIKKNTAGKTVTISANSADGKQSAEVLIMVK